MEVPQKFKNRTTIKSSNSTPGYFSKENKRPNSKRYIHPYVHCTIFHNIQDMEVTYMSAHRYMNGYIYIYIHTHTHTHTHTHNVIILSHKKRMKSCHLQQHGWT